MTDLSPKARALLASSRTSLRPTSSDRERIEVALRTKLGVDAMHVPSRVSWQVLTGAAAGALLLGVVAWRVVPEEPSQPAPQATSVASPAPLEAPAPTPIEVDPAPPEALPPALDNKPSMKVSAPKDRDHLALEVELLSRATRALRAGHADEALRTLDEHKRKFPKGALRQERRLARARALCTLGRVTEGRAELEHLPKDAPATARALKACDL